MLLRTLYYFPLLLMEEWKSPERIEKNSLKKARALLKNVIRINPFYKKKLKGVPIDTIETIQDLKHIPFTTKDELREAFPQDISSGYTAADCVHESTSGSTGDVLNIYHDPAAYDFFIALGMREYTWWRYNPRYTMLYIRYEHFKKTAFESIRLLRRKRISVTSSAEKQLALLLEQAPDVICGYPSSLYEIGKLIEERNIKIKTPKFINSNSELLTEPIREYIESVFGCPVYNEYSSFEVHSIATECSKKEMHIHMDNNILEVIKDGEQVGPGEKGEIVVTNLRNQAMPFIRYRTGDIGVLSDEQCSCGRGLPLLEMIEGRKDEFLHLPSGGKISPRVFDPLDFIFHDYVLKFQIIQMKIDSFIIKVVPRPEYGDDVRKKLIREAKNCFPESISVEVVEVEDINRTGRGKLRAVLNKVKA
jgi:phenylacetate-CoA ligase